jgi:hypothetical protein
LRKRTIFTRRVRMGPQSKALTAFLRLLFIPLLSAVVSAAWTVRIQEPPPGQLFVENLWALNVTNPEAQGVDVRIHGWVSEASLGRVFEGTSNVIRLEPGPNRITSRDITNVSEVFRHPRYRDVILRTGRFPEGRYTEVCAEVIRAQTGEELGYDCIEQRVVLPSPLRLIAPPDESSVTETFPLFQWSPVSEAESYELRICEILEGQEPEDAMGSNPPRFEADDIPGALFRYPLAARRLEDGRRYAWRVHAFLGTSPLVRSPVFSFTFGAEKELISREEAIQMILKRVIVPGTLEHDLLAFLGREPLTEGDTVFQDVELQVVRAVEGPTWFAWLYDEPTMEFEHETRYVFVDALTGELEVKSQSWWPMLNRRLIWNTREEMAGDRFVFFRNPSE